MSDDGGFDDDDDDNDNYCLSVLLGGRKAH